MALGPAHSVAGFVVSQVDVRGFVTDFLLELLLTCFFFVSIIFGFTACE